MAFPQGINFRSTAGYVTDGANEDKEAGTSIANYPRTSAQGNTVGFEIAPFSTADRVNTNDRRLAGINYTNVSNMKYRIDLPATGSYDITVGAGDGSFSNNTKVELFDTTTSLGVLCSGSTGAANSFKDATNATLTAANWPGSNAVATKTFSSTICRFVFGDATTICVIAHVAVAASAGGGGQTSTVGSVAGVATLSGVSNTLWNTAGNSTGVGTAVGISGSTQQVQTVGVSTGLGTAVGVGNTVTNAVGNSAGVGSGAAVGLAVQPGQTTGISSGIATVSGIANTLAYATGSSSGISDAAGVNPQVVVNQIGVVTSAGGELTWRDHVKAVHEMRMLEGRIKEQKKELQKVVKKLKTVEKKVKAEKNEGILANLVRLEFKKDEIENKIQALEVDLAPLIMFLEKWEIEEDDNEFMSLQ